jgi:CRISPR-associated protein Cas1
MVGTRIQKLVLEDHGSYLGMEKGCFVVKNRNKEVERYPLFEQEIGEIVLKSGNAVSTGALASCGFWNIDVLVTTQRGRPVAMLRGLDDDSHVETRIAQYEATKNGKGIRIAKQLVASKLEGRNSVLRKHGLKTYNIGESIEGLEFESLRDAQKRLVSIEGKYDELYFPQIFSLLPEKIRPDKRKKFMAYDGANNLFNLAYEVLSWKVHRALTRAKLEPYLGFLHSLQWGKPSLVCDFQEIYRYLIDDFVVQYSQMLTSRDFTTKTEVLSRNKRGKRQYLNDARTKEMMEQLNGYFESMVEIPRMKVGERQTIETLIGEEALLFAKYLRGEIGNWAPRMAGGLISTLYK